MGRGKARERILLGVLLAAAIFAPQALAISRKQASAIALKTLGATKHKGNIAVYGLPKPLPAKDVVVEAGPGPTAKSVKLVQTAAGHELRTVLPARRLGRPTWLFWEDLAPGSNFEHSSRLLLVDAKTGKVTRSQRYSWYPLVNLKPPAFIVNPASDRIYVRPKQHRTAAVVRAPLGTTRRFKAQYPNDCMLLAGDRNDPRPVNFEGDLEAMTKLANSLGIRTAESQDGSAKGLEDGLTGLLSTKPCQDVTIVLAGHGPPPPGLLPGDPGTPVAAVATRQTYSEATGQVENIDQVVTSTDILNLIAKFRR